MDLKEIAEKYVYGNHEALTDRQEIIDMMNDINLYVTERIKELSIPINHAELVCSMHNKHISLEVERGRCIICGREAIMKPNKNI